jgi:hypothetical protein
MNGARPDSSLFKIQGDEIGVSTTLWLTAQDEVDTLRWHESDGLVSISVGLLRSKGFGVIRTALVGNLNHCEVFGLFSGANRKALRDHTKIVKYPNIYNGERFPVETF